MQDIPPTEINADTESPMEDIFRDIKTESFRRLREKERPAEKVTIVKAHAWQRVIDMLGIALVFLLIAGAVGTGVYYWQRSIRERDRVLFETSMALLTEKMELMVAEFDRAIEDIKQANAAVVNQNTQLEKRVQQLLVRNDQLQNKMVAAQRTLEAQQKTMQLDLAESKKELEMVKLDKLKLQYLLETIENNYDANARAWKVNPPLAHEGLTEQYQEEGLDPSSATYRTQLHFGAYPAVPKKTEPKNTDVSWLKRLFS